MRNVKGEALVEAAVVLGRGRHQPSVDRDREVLQRYVGSLWHSPHEPGKTYYLQESLVLGELSLQGLEGDAAAVRRFAHHFVGKSNLSIKKDLFRDVFESVLFDIIFLA